MNWAICNQDVGVIALQRRASNAAEHGEQAGQLSNLLQRQDTTMSRNHRPKRQHSRLNEVRNLALGAAVSALVRFLLDQLRVLL
ncbi:hypothetical protein [Streptomyces sp. NPDC007929]|uniref:hypothetical protein n=1 Tax=unclassified Streptomyces TaxID=2593676 RepID=UPI0036E7A9BD